MEKFIIHSKEYRSHHGHFLKYLQAVGYSQQSCRTFAGGMREFFWWLERKRITGVEDVKENHVEDYHHYQQERPSREGTLSESRITLHMYTLKLFFQYLLDTDQIEVNPMGNLHYVREYKRTRENLLSTEDIKELYQSCETARHRAILGIIYGCGLRKQEAEKLNTRDIHFKSGLLYVREGKGGRKRTIPLNRKVLSDFKEYYINERPGQINYRGSDLEAFMLNNHGTRMRGETYAEEIKKLVSKAKLNQQITLHHFRHAIATHLIEGGMQLEHVKDFLGHMSIETTQTYTHISTAQMKRTTAYETETISA